MRDVTLVLVGFLVGVLLAWRPEKWKTPEGWMVSSLGRRRDGR